MFDPRPLLSESPQGFLGESVHLNCPDKKQISGFGLPLIAVAKIKNILSFGAAVMIFLLAKVPLIFSVNEE